MLPPGRSAAGRSAASTCCCVVETVLSTIIFILTMKRTLGETHDWLDFGRNAPWFSVALGVGCGTWTGVSHIFTYRVQEAVHNIVTIHECETNRLGRSGRGDSRGLDDVNLFEYHDIVTIGLDVTAVFYLLFLCLLWWLGVCFWFGLCWVLLPFNLFSGPNTTFWGVGGVGFIIWLGCYPWLIYKGGVVGKFRKFREACRTRPSYARVQTLILLSSILCAVVFNVPLVPSLWRWSLIATHTTRAIKVYASLEGPHRLVEAPHGEFSGDTL